MNIKQTKKQYEAPEMSVLDYEYGDCLLTDSCTDSECVDIPTQDPPETTGQLG